MKVVGGCLSFAISASQLTPLSALASRSRLAAHCQPNCRSRPPRRRASGQALRLRPPSTPGRDQALRYRQLPQAQGYQTGRANL